jgi:hypothetical protein
MAGALGLRIARTLLLLAASILFHSGAASSQNNSQESPVLGVPPVVDAGSSVTVQVSLSNAGWPNPQCQGPSDCSWEFFRAYVQACPRYVSLNIPGPFTNGGTSIFWETYCAYLFRAFPAPRCLKCIAE